MIINTSTEGTLNIRFKGKEIGFAPNEKKLLGHILNESEEKELANKYNSLIYVPTPKKIIKTTQETDIEKVKEIVNTNFKIEEPVIMSQPILTTTNIVIQEEQNTKETFDFTKEGVDKMLKQEEDTTDYFKEDDRAEQGSCKKYFTEEEQKDAKKEYNQTYQHKKKLEKEAKDKKKK
jgi:RNA-splicing ligase RtcB